MAQPLSSYLRPATKATPPTITHQSERERGKAFGQAVCAALIQLAAAVWRYYVDDFPPFVRGK